MKVQSRLVLFFLLYPFSGTQCQNAQRATTNVNDSEELINNTRRFEPLDTFYSRPTTAESDTTIHQLTAKSTTAALGNRV